MRRLRGWIFGIAVALLSEATAAAMSPPVAVIEALHGQLIETMKQADRLGIEGRYAQLQPLLERSFDFERMISAATGSYWSAAGEAERQRLRDAFIKLSITTYAARFNGYNGESFATVGERPGPRDSVLVDTRLDRVKEPAVPITYVMIERNGTWQIIDVLLDRSISELAVRRSEYNQVLRNGGPDRLAQTLDEKAAQLRSE